MTNQFSPPAETGFSLRLLSRACDGAGTLRDTLIGAGLTPGLVARAAGVHVRTLRAITDGGRTPRGVLVRLAGLAVIVDQLAEHDVPATALRDSHTTASDAVVQDIRAQSPIAAKLIDAIRSAPARRDGQLSFPVAA